MRPSHAVVGLWAAGNLVLALVLFLFTPAPPVALLYVTSVAIVAGFGLAVLLALRSGRVGVQQRQPRRATASAFAAIAVGLGLSGLVYGWWVSVLAIYPLGMAIWMLRGERLRPGAEPWPVAADGTEPAGPARYLYHGSSTGSAAPVPVQHPAHGPPEAPQRRPLGAAQKVGWAVLIARAIVELLRRRR